MAVSSKCFIVVVVRRSPYVSLYKIDRVYVVERIVKSAQSGWNGAASARGDKCRCGETILVKLWVGRVIA
jgi:hypothetical protein